MDRRLALAAAILALVLSALWWRTTPERPAPLVDPTADATYGDFTVQTDAGELSLSELQGRVVVVYFGYTACPDICPTTLASTAAAVRLLTPEEQARVTALMVSIDPERDAVDRLGEYVRYFHPSFLAGTRDLPEVTAIAQDWGVVFRKVHQENSAMGYAVDHSTDAYLVGADGRFRERLPHGTPAPEVAQRLRTALAEARE